MGRNPGRVLHLTKEAPSLAPSARGRAPRSGGAWITAGSQAPSQDQGGGAGGVLLLQTQSGLSKAISNPGPFPQSTGQSLGKMERPRPVRTPWHPLGYGLLWLILHSRHWQGASFTSAEAPGKSWTQTLSPEASRECSYRASSSPTLSFPSQVELPQPPAHPWHF